MGQQLMAPVRVKEDQAEAGGQATACLVAGT